MRWTLNLLFLFGGYVVSLLVFQRALLVKRHVLTSRSSCDDDVASRDKDSCWLPARHKHVVWLVVDALRFDFIKPSATGGFSRGHMPLTAALLNNSQKARLFRTVCDAPTTTFQRIKAIITGNVPAFIEASENFDGSAVVEDNLVEQIVAAGGNVTFLGDDTWSHLLPNRFRREFSLPSFDIKDLDTVDDMVRSKIYDELRRDDWTLLVAHVLGVDHCGHRYGVEHAEMTRKLREMDALIHNITRTMPDDAVLMVFGDHGMTPSGDHGGDSAEETEAALFVYSRWDLPLAAEQARFAGKSVNDEDYLTVDQIDLVPTTSLLLGVPIPFSNLGSVIESLFDADIVGEALRLNAVQVLRYAQDYVRFFDASLHATLSPILSSGAGNEADAAANRMAVELARDTLRAHFQKIDLPVALIGILSLAETLLFTANVALDFNGYRTVSISAARYVFRSALILLQLALYFGAVNEMNTTRGSGFEGRRVDLLAFTILTLATSILYTALTLLTRWIADGKCWRSAVGFERYIVSGVWSDEDRATFCLSSSFLWRSSLLIGTCAQALSAISNSYIIYESDVLRMALQSLLAACLWDTVVAAVMDRSTSKTSGKFLSTRHHHSLFKRIVFGNQRDGGSFTALKIVFSMAAVRLSKAFESCREEQVECADSAPELSAGWPLALSIVSLLALNAFNVYRSAVVVRRMEATRHDSRLGAAIVARRLSAAASWLVALCAVLHLVCEWLPHALFDSVTATTTESTAMDLPLIEGLSRSGSIRSAQLVYLAVVLHFAAGMIVGGFRRGSAAFRCAIMASHRHFLVVALVMLVGGGGDHRAVPIVCLVAVVGQLLNEDVFVATNRSIDASLARYLLGALSFYAFAHQCTLTAIPWRAAFVGLPGNFTLKPVAAALVIVHLFSGNFLSLLNAFCRDDDDADKNTMFYGKCEARRNYLRNQESVGVEPNARENLTDNSGCGENGVKHGNGLRGELVAFAGFNALRALGACVACTIHVRHLMFYKVFAPKFAYEAVNLLFCCAVILFYNSIRLFL